MPDRGVLFIITMIVALVAACDAKRDAMPEVRAPVVVYAPAEVEEGLTAWFADSGLAVTIVTGESAALTDKVINKQDSPPADVLLTSNVLDIWRAGEEGALRPIDRAALQGIPAVLKDPDNAWTAYRYHRLVIAAAQDASGDRKIGFRDLGDAELAGKLCLSSSRLPTNRMLVGMLIEELGVRPAERLIRGWVRNLARAPFAGEHEVVEALKRGDCGIGIVAARDDLGSLTVMPTDPTYVAIDGVGISRHAPHPEAAQRLVGWMLSTYRPDEWQGSVVNNVGIGGWRAEDARLLVERAGYR